METINSEIEKTQVKHLEQPVKYDVYNSSRNHEIIDVFSDNYKPHTGVVRDDKDTYYNSERNEEIGMIRFHFNDKITSEYIYDYYLVGDNDTYMKKIMYLKDFSPFQFQQSIIDIDYKNVSPNNFKIKIPLSSKREISFRVFPKNESNTLNKNNESDKETDTKKLSDIFPKHQFCVIVENNTNFVKEIDLMSLVNGTVKKTKDESSEKGTINFKYVGDNEECFDGKINIENVINDISDYVKTFNTLKIVSNNSNQLTQVIKYITPDEEKIIPIITQFYFSAMQFQANVLEINFPFELSSKHSLKTPILPKTKIMYYFYESDLKKQKDEFSGNDYFVPIFQKDVVPFEDIEIISSLKDIKEEDFIYWEFNIENKSNEEKETVLLGSYFYLNSANFGNSIHIEINCLTKGKSYIECLKDTEINPFKALEVIVTAEGDNNIRYVKTNANGDIWQPKFNFINSAKFVPSELKDNAFGKFDGNTYLKFKMKPNSKWNFKIKREL